MRVLDLVEDDDEGILRIEQPARIGIGIRIDLGHHSLVIGRTAEQLELLRGCLGRPPDAMDEAPSSFRLSDRAPSIDPLALGH